MTTDETALREALSRIDRNLAENQKLVAEAGKLNEETRKFVAESHKLDAESNKLAAEGRKFQRDVAVQTLLAVTGLIGGIITVARVIWPNYPH